MKKYVIASIIFNIHAMVLGQNVYELEPTVVTATRYPKNIMDITRTIIIIDSSEINKCTSVSEILKISAGVDMKLRGDGVQADPSIRGSTFQQVLIMIDGLRINDPQTGHHNLNIPIPLSEIERIEILQGTASSLYGSDACGGVINIITKKQSGIAGRLGLGSFGYKEGAGRLATDKISFGFDTKFSDGHQPGYEYSLYNASIKSNFDIANNKVMLQAGYLNKKFGAKNFYAPYPSWEKNQAFIITLNNQWVISPYFMLNPTLIFRTHIDTFILDRDNPEFYANRHQSFTYGAQLISHLDLNKFGYILSGTEIFKDSLNSTRLGPHEQWRTALFFQGERGFFNKRLILIAGSRADFYANFGNTMNPHFSLAYRAFPHLKFRGAVGTSFRAPSFTELYYQDPANRGDSLLKPESAREYELGSDFQHGSLAALITFYYRKTTQDIDWVKKETETIWQARNIGHARFYGVESSSEFAFMPWLHLKSGLSYIQLVDRLPGEYLSKYVLQIPKATIDTKLTLFTVSEFALIWSYYEEMPRLILNFNLNKEFRILKKVKLVSLFAITNLLDRIYQDYQDVPLPGRSVRATISVSKI